jgi:DNA-binding XRE family transcriptional regulator
MPLVKCVIKVTFFCITNRSLTSIISFIDHFAVQLSMSSDLYNCSDKELIGLWGEKLKELLIASGLSQTELAEKIGMSRSSIAEIEKNRNFYVDSFIAISRLLNQFEFFLKKQKYELTPMEIYALEKEKKRI